MRKNILDEPPNPQEVVVHLPGGKAIVACCFDTDRAPYLFKNPRFGQPGGGPVELEVPWREAGHTRSARHGDLLRLLLPLVGRPQVYPLSALVEVQNLSDLGLDYVDPSRPYQWTARGSFYVEPARGDEVVVPFRRWKARITQDYLDASLDLQIASAGGSGRSPRTIVTESEMYINGPSEIKATFVGDTPGVQLILSSSIKGVFSMHPAWLEAPIQHEMLFSPAVYPFSQGAPLGYWEWRHAGGE
jgi:hypothetical protein